MAEWVVKSPGKKPVKIPDDRMGMTTDLGTGELLGSSSTPESQGWKIQPPPPTLLDQAIINPVKSIGAGVQQSVSGIGHLVKNAADLVDRSAGALDTPWNPTLRAVRPIAQAISRGGQAMQDYYASEAERLRGGRTDLASKIYEGMGSAAVEIPKYMTGGAILGGMTRSMAALGALEQADKGVVPTIIGGAKGAAMGKALHLVGPATIPTRVGTLGTIFGSEAALSGGDATDIAASAIVGGGLGVMGGRGNRIADLRRDPLKPLFNLQPESEPAPGAVPIQSTPAPAPAPAPARGVAPSPTGLDALHRAQSQLGSVAETIPSRILGVTPYQRHLDTTLGPAQSALLPSRLTEAQRVYTPTPEQPIPREVPPRAVPGPVAERPVGPPVGAPLPPRKRPLPPDSSTLPSSREIAPELSQFQTETAQAQAQAQAQANLPPRLSTNIPEGFRHPVIRRRGESGMATPDALTGGLADHIAREDPTRPFRTEPESEGRKEVVQPAPVPVRPPRTPDTLGIPGAPGAPGAPVAEPGPQFARTASGKIVAKTNTGRMADIVTTGLYSGDLSKIIVKEAMQNAQDAVRSLPPGTGKIDVEVYDGSKVLRIRDNGQGMLPSVLENEFVDPASSGKVSDTSASGGFGIGNIAVLKLSDKVRVVSVADDPATGQRLRSTFDINWKDLIEGNLDPPRVEVVDKKVPTGTDLQAHVTDKHWSSYEISNFLKNFQERSVSIPGEVTVRKGWKVRPTREELETRQANKELLNSYEEFQLQDYQGKLDSYLRPSLESEYGLQELKPDSYEPLTKIASTKIPDVAQVDFYAIKPKTPNLGDILAEAFTASNEVRVEVSNNGIYQFTHSINLPSDAKAAGLPKRLAVDIKADPKATEGSANYPFKASRQQLHDSVLKEMKDYLTKEFIEPAQKAYVDFLGKKYESLPTIKSPSGQEFPFYDSGKRLTPDETTQILNNAELGRIAQSVHDLASQAIAILRPKLAGKGVGFMTTLDEFGASIKRFGLVFAPEIHGVYVPKPGSKTPQTTSTSGEATVLVNPFSFGSKDPADIASLVWHTIKHELIHDRVSGHYEAFTSAEAEVSHGLGGFELKALQRLYNDYSTGLPGPDGTPTLRKGISDALSIYEQSRTRPETEKDIFGGEKLGSQPDVAGTRGQTESVGGLRPSGTNPLGTEAKQPGPGPGSGPGPSPQLPARRPVSASRRRTQGGTADPDFLSLGLASIADKVAAKAVAESKEWKNLAEKFRTNSADAAKHLVNFVAPRAKTIQLAQDIIFRSKGERQRETEAFNAAIAGMHATVAKLSPQEQIDMVSRSMRGEPQANPTLQAIADFGKKLSDRNYEIASKYDPWLEYKENYGVGIVWKTPPKHPNWDQRSGRPRDVQSMRGAAGFTKQRFWQDLKTGMDYGGVPMSTNYVELMGMNYAHVQKFISAQKMFEGLKSIKQVVWVDGFHNAPPPGFVEFKADVAKSYFSPEGKKSYDKGYWAIAEGPAGMLRNYLSRDIWRDLHTAEPGIERVLAHTGRSIMNIKNAYTMWELGVSAFHPMFITAEAQLSYLGTALRKLINLGDVKGFGRDLGMAFGAPLAAGESFLIGRNAKEFFTETVKMEQGLSSAKSVKDLMNFPQFKRLFAQFPDAAEALEQFFVGGGTLGLHPDYHTSFLKSAKDALSQGRITATLGNSIMAFPELFSTPIFKHYIPALKLGNFLREYSLSMLENEARLAAGKTTKDEIARKTLEFTEDRFGEMNFDNLFWNKTFKTSLQMMFRSVTWILGNTRSMFTAVPQQALYTTKRALGDTRKLGPIEGDSDMPILAPKFAWLLGMGMFNAVLGAVTQFLSIGKPPEELKDLVFPRYDEHGGRIVLPTSIKEAMAFLLHPMKRLRGGLSGIWGKGRDVLTNQDFSGTQVYYPDDPVTSQAWDVFQHLFPMPISFSAWQQAQKSGGPRIEKFGSALGFLKAPRYVVDDAATTKLREEMESRGLHVIRTKSESERSRMIAGTARAWAAGRTDQAREIFTKGLSEGILVRDDLAKVLERKKLLSDPNSGLIEGIKRLPPVGALNVWEVASDEQKLALREEVQKKLYSAIANLPKIQLDAVIRKAKEVGWVEWHRDKIMSERRRRAAAAQAPTLAPAPASP